jgi:hypothetical protein
MTVVVNGVQQEELVVSEKRNNLVRNLSFQRSDQIDDPLGIGGACDVISQEKQTRLSTDPLIAFID